MNTIVSRIRLNQEQYGYAIILRNHLTLQPSHLGLSLLLVAAQKAKQNHPVTIDSAILGKFDDFTLFIT